MEFRVKPSTLQPKKSWLDFWISRLRKNLTDAGPHGWEGESGWVLSTGRAGAPVQPIRLDAFSWRPDRTNDMNQVQFSEQRADGNTFELSRVSKPDMGLLRWIIATDQPTSVVETREFRNLLKDTPSITLGSSAAVERRIYLMAKDIVNKEKNRMKVVPQVTLLVHFWTPRVDHHPTTFIGITVQYAAAGGQHVERVLNFCEVKSDNSAITDAILKTVEMYELKTKTVYFMLDNDPKSDLVIKELQMRYADTGASLNIHRFRLKSVEHSLHQAAQQLARGFSPKASGGAEEPPPSDGDISTALNKLRLIIRHLNSQPVQEREAIERTSAHRPTPGSCTPLGLVLDEDRLWFTTFKMMGAALRYRCTMETYTNGQHGLDTAKLSLADWRSISVATNCLAQFSSALKRAEVGSVSQIRSDPRARGSALLYRLLDAQKSLAGWLRGVIAEAPHPSLATALRNCHSTLLRHHCGPSSSPVYIWTFVLNPCVKLQGLLMGATHRKELETIVQAWGELEQMIHDTYFPESLLKVYAARQELHRYVSLSVENPGCDAITWWQVRLPLFPLLSPLALSILSIPGNSVAGEHMAALYRKTVNLRRTNQRLGTRTLLTAVALNPESFEN
ncbi:hypothetical protein PM082_022271 [Marasmius tenuissimus]|nr:hypothetical protein PM082_022271 [Marasmius tenuissimus]